MKAKVISTLIITIIMSICVCGCDGSTSATYEGTTRDYDDVNDARNTDRHFDDDEYREGLNRAREVWDAQT